MTPAKESVAAWLTIYRGLPFYRKLRYETPNGGKVDVTNWIGLLELRASLDSDAVLYTFSTSPEEGQGQMNPDKGFIELVGPSAAESAAMDWEEAVGHLVLGPTQDKVSPLVFLGFRIQTCTTGVPPTP